MSADNRERQLLVAQQLDELADLAAGRKCYTTSFGSYNFAYHQQPVGAVEVISVRKGIPPRGANPSLAHTLRRIAEEIRQERGRCARYEPTSDEVTEIVVVLGQPIESSLMLADDLQWRDGKLVSVG